MEKRFILHKVLLIIPFLLFILNTTHSQELVFLIKFDIFKNGTIINDKVDILESDTYLPLNGFGNYTLELLDYQGNLLYKERFHIPFARISFVPTEKGFEELNKTSFMARIPYFRNAKYLKFFENDKILLNIDLEKRLCVEDGKCPDFCKGKNIDPDCPVEKIEKKYKCGNGICESSLGENQSNCPQDCKLKSIEEKRKGKWWIYAIIIFLIILTAFVLFTSIKR